MKLTIVSAFGLFIVSIGLLVVVFTRPISGNGELDPKILDNITCYTVYTDQSMDIPFECWGRAKIESPIYDPCEPIWNPITEDITVIDPKACEALIN